MKKFVRRVAIAVAVAAVGFGLTATPAFAEDSTPAPDAAIAAPEASTTLDSLPTPSGAEDAKWDSALSQAEAKFGAGDKAYLEALRATSPARLSGFYCNSYENITRPGAWYKFPRVGDTLDCVMETGLVNPGVRALQETLNRCYGQGLVLDGDFGPATYNALSSVQAWEGIGVDGVYGPITRSNIKWWGGGSICTYGWQLGH